MLSRGQLGTLPVLYLDLKLLEDSIVPIIQEAQVCDPQNFREAE